MFIEIALGTSFLLNGICLVSYLKRMDSSKQVDHITEEKIRDMAEAGEVNGSIAPIASEMIGNIFDLSRTSIGDIATHRRDIVAIPVNASIDELTKVIADEKYSRIVVYNENIDDIVGIFHVKDFVKYFIDKHQQKKGFYLKDTIKEPFFVPFSKKTSELFQEMQQRKVHMAVIIDEYGGTAGIVTMEDMIEEIVGNIFDEYDIEEEEEICKLDDGTYRLSGSADLEDISIELKLDFFEKEEYDTIGGYLVGRVGRIPDENETIEIQEGSWVFIVEKIEDKRIEKILAIPVIVEQTENINLESKSENSAT